MAALANGAISEDFIAAMKKEALPFSLRTAHDAGPLRPRGPEEPEEPDRRTVWLDTGTDSGTEANPRVAIAVRVSIQKPIGFAHGAVTAEHRRHRRRGRGGRHHRLAADSSPPHGHWYNHVSVVTRRHLIDDAGWTKTVRPWRPATSVSPSSPSPCKPAASCRARIVLGAKRRLTHEPATFAHPRGGPQRVLLEVKRSPDVEIGGRLIGHVLQDGFDVLDFIPTGPEPDIATDIELLPDRRYQLWTLDALLELDDDLAVLVMALAHPQRVGALFWSRPQVLRGQDAASLSLRWDGLRPDSRSTVFRGGRGTCCAAGPAQGDVGEHTYWAEDAIE